MIYLIELYHCIFAMYRASIKLVEAQGRGWEDYDGRKVEAKVHTSNEKMPMDSAGLQYKARTG